jgi:hypothetical protein
VAGSPARTVPRRYREALRRSGGEKTHHSAPIAYEVFATLSEAAMRRPLQTLSFFAGDIVAPVLGRPVYAPSNLGKQAGLAEAHEPTGRLEGHEAHEEDHKEDIFGVLRFLQSSWSS